MIVNENWTSVLNRTNNWGCAKRALWNWVSYLHRFKLHSVSGRHNFQNLDGCVVNILLLMTIMNFWSDMIILISCLLKKQGAILWFLAAIVSANSIHLPLVNNGPTSSSKRPQLLKVCWKNFPISKQRNSINKKFRAAKKRCLIYKLRFFPIKRQNCWTRSLSLYDGLYKMN